MEKELERVARRLFWWEPPDAAIANKVIFLCQAMTYGTAEDMAVVQKYFSREDLVAALERAPAGIFDARSWHYWNLKLGRTEVPPLPRRPFMPEEKPAGKRCP